jgi:hypothetical protein
MAFPFLVEFYYGTIYRLGGIIITRFLPKVNNYLLCAALAFSSWCC